MPSTAGRVRMPHNNRVSTSGALATNDIWSKTIGHNPYAAASEDQQADISSNAAENADKAKGLLELARHQNIAGDTSSRDDFARKLYLGLKSGKKKRRGDVESAAERDEGRRQELVAALNAQVESSSED
eukprot:CAMPEP_0119009158 /NCGR_PEP_ID=MMETSP1176-20130426/4184_1 /TAXON_ID=265551 /ORGANISM="Synedropsis recta cf, Strain CCMP1620" /LENGTH=128 /DNA_ID=CAMNT_0006961617 /DNA_START=109 /DNA_END=492 /DNA_ORIENTATION=+